MPAAATRARSISTLGARSVGCAAASRRVRSEVGDAATPDPGLLDRAIAAGARPGVLVTVDRPVVTAAAKSALCGANPEDEARVVDMESAAWAREAALRGIPYVVVRVVSDTAVEELPDFLAESIGTDGSIRRGEVARRALLEPSSWGSLLRMRRRLHECSDALGVFVARMLES